MNSAEEEEADSDECEIPALEEAKELRDFLFGLYLCIYKVVNYENIFLKTCVVSRS